MPARMPTLTCPPEVSAAVATDEREGNGNPDTSVGYAADAQAPETHRKTASATAGKRMRFFN